MDVEPSPAMPSYFDQDVIFHEVENNGPKSGQFISQNNTLDSSFKSPSEDPNSFYGVTEKDVLTKDKDLLSRKDDLSWEGIYNEMYELSQSQNRPEDFDVEDAALRKFMEEFEVLDNCPNESFKDNDDDYMKYSEPAQSNPQPETPSASSSKTNQLQAPNTPIAPVQSISVKSIEDVQAQLNRVLLAVGQIPTQPHLKRAYFETWNKYIRPGYFNNNVYPY